MSIEFVDQPAVELVDLDHDGEPDRFDHGTELAERPDVEPVHVGPPLDGELVDDEQPRQVDPAPQRLPLDLRVKHADRRPVVPVWARSPEDARQVVKWVAGHAGHSAAFHAVRLPVYLAKLAVRAPVGLVKTGTAVGGWVLDAEGRPLRRQAVERGDTDTYLRLSAERQQRVRHRLVAAGVVAVLVAVAMLLAFWLMPWVGWLVSGLGVLGLGLVGTPRDKPVAGRAVVVERYSRLTSDMVERALKSLGLSAMAAKGARIEFPAPIQRDGPGWRAEVDLPFGVTAADVIERRDRLAAGLRRPLGAVWPEPVNDEHPGRVVVWVGDVPMNKAKAPAWPLLKAGKVDIFKPVPFIVDQRMRPVGLDLVFWNMLIGAMPRMGKTFALRLVVLAAALDPFVQLRLFELKGTGDLGMCEPVAHHYASGAGKDAKDTTLASLRELYAELETRAETITRVAKENPAACPENKVTPELSRDPRLGLEIVLAVIDECQELFSDKELREDAERLCEGIIKRGPALGIILILATQRPDAKSLPKGVSDNVGIRFALRVMGQEANDMILGTSSYKSGIRATTFTASDKGIGYLDD